MAATKETLKDLQRNMKAMGLYAGVIDGLWGPASHGAFTNARRLATKLKGPSQCPTEMGETLYKYCKATAWSEKVSTAFIEKVKVMATNLKLGWQGADELMSCMAFETGETFSPSIKNGAGAPYYGLIQFGSAAATDVKTTTAALVKMTAEEQLDYVYAFFKPYAGRLKDFSDIYLRILWPAAVGKPADFIIFIDDGKSKRYTQNRGLDMNRDGKVTKAEAAAKAQQKLVAGLHPKNLRV